MSLTQASDKRGRFEIGSSDKKSNQKNVPDKMFDSLNDKGGRRSATDRRGSSGANHFPERRSYRFRRDESDRRNPRNFRVIKKGTERREAFKDI